MKKIIVSLCLILTLLGCSSKEKEPVVKVANAQSGYQCARDHLKTKAEKQTYDALLDSMLKLEKETIIKGVTTHQLENIISDIKTDHPELYYVNDRYDYITDENFEENKVTTVQLKYRFTKKEVDTYNKKIEEVSAAVIKKAKSMKHDYDKARVLYDFVLDRTKYDEKSKENQNILSVFLYKSSVCAGYAKSFQYLCNQVGIPCTYITGFTKASDDISDSSHAWNMIQIDGTYYYSDTTNGDNYQTKQLRYGFLTMTLEQMDTLNRPDNRDYYKKTISNKDSYFVRNNAYFTSVDEDQIRALIRKELNSGEPFRLVYQCADENIAARIEKMITEDSNLIFDMTGIDQFTYYEIAETNCYAFVPEGANI